MNDKQKRSHQSNPTHSEKPKERGSESSVDHNPGKSQPKSGGEFKDEFFISEVDEIHSDRLKESQSPSKTHTKDSFTEQLPLGWGEVIGVFLLIVLADITIYRGKGFAGYALLFFFAPILFWISSTHRCRGAALGIVSGMLAALSVKMVWCGSGALVACGFALLVAYAMSLAGLRPYVLEAVFFALQSLHAGYLGILQYGRRFNRLGPKVPQTRWINVALPLLAFLVFGWIFVLANPDLTVLFGEGMTQLFEMLHDLILYFSPQPLEFSFWLAVFWIVVGLLRPAMDRLQADSSSDESSTDETAPATDAYLYPAFRNTLVTLIVLFAVYLVFEFKSMWFHVFPKGFHYSGYAHEGAAWLTAALALATVILSLVFRGDILHEHRIATLRRLAWLWSLENMLLAASVYNRLFIYIDFNGMTRMRIVGLYGMSAVVVGFLLVVWKIIHNHDLLWLVRHHLWTLAISLYLLAMTPLDRIVVGYNVRRILNGDPAPSVQISVHPINSEGILFLQPLLECDDEIIREGVRALLAEHHNHAEVTAAQRSTLDWTTYQIADRIALEEFRKNSKQWQRYSTAVDREIPLKRFHDYAYQWF